MAKRRRTKPLPLPRSWLSRTEWEGERRSARDTALAGVFPRPGTLAHLRVLLSAAGWEPDALTTKALEHTRERLYDMQTERSNKKDPEIDKLATELRGLGLVVDPIPRKKGTYPTQWVKDIWGSMATHPGWVAGTGGQRSLFLVSNTTERVETASSLFIHDVFSTLGEEPEWRMPTFRRMSLVALMSPEMMNHFMEGAGQATDLLVVHGGFIDEASLYQSFAHLNAVKSMFNGFLIYEAVVPMGEEPARVAAAARRSGFPTVLGVG